MAKSTKKPATNEYVWIDYTNHRGERAYRLIHPVKVVFESNEWHKEPQWLWHAIDLEKKAIRTFAMPSFHDWFSWSEIETAEKLLREKVSISHLQRNLQIGYNRANRIIEMFEKRGLVKGLTFLTEPKK